jgi:hypothetical protein
VGGRRYGRASGHLRLVPGGKSQRALRPEKTPPLPVQKVDPLDLYVRVQGPTAAGWLVWQHRRLIHRTGKADFHVMLSAETPPWFRVAFETLKRRKGWMVDSWESTQGRHYRIVWLDWQKYSARARAQTLVKGEWS